MFKFGGTMIMTSYNDSYLFSKCFKFISCSSVACHESVIWAKKKIEM